MSEVILIAIIIIITVSACAGIANPKVPSNTSFYEMYKAKKAKKPNPMIGRTLSDDGHTIPYKDDITCEAKDGHSHPTSNQPRYIVHEEPEDGYVVLNGKKVKIKDLK